MAEISTSTGSQLWLLFQENLNLFQLIFQPFINGFCFNIGHLNELQLVLRMNKYSLRGEVIWIICWKPCYWIASPNFAPKSCLKRSPKQPECRTQPLELPPCFLRRSVKLRNGVSPPPKQGEEIRNSPTFSLLTGWGIKGANLVSPCVSEMLLS